MGLHDYEHLSAKIHPVKTTTGKERSYLVAMANNVNWLNSVYPWVLKDDPITDLFNRPVFKATKLREEIFFIKCKLYNIDGDINEFVFVVNEHSIYKRFRIYREKNSSLFFTNIDTPLNEYIDMIKSCNYRIDLRLFNNEIENLKLIYRDLPAGYQYYENYGFRNGSIIEPISIQHYNKRAWIYLLTTNNIIDLDLDYKNSKSDAYYDDKFALKYN